MVFPSCSVNGTSNLECLFRETLAFLHQTVGFDLWMITRVDGKDWIILQVDDHSYGVAEGTVFNWMDSCCYQMVLGNGPFITSAVQNIDAYTRAPIVEHLEIGAYAGVPLLSKSGDLFGTLCAIHPEPLPQSVEAHLPLITITGKLITALIDARLEPEATMEQTAEFETLLFRDSLTSVFNRHAWNKLLAKEEENCKVLGQSACIISIDLDLDNLKRINYIKGHSAGDEYLRRAARLIKSALSGQYIGYLARVGGDKFAILCVDCSFKQGKALADKVQTNLGCSQIITSIGLAELKPELGLFRAWEEANLSVQTKAMSSYK